MSGDGPRQRVQRREYLAAVGAVGATAAISGCLEFITGDAAEFEATPSRVRQSALDETGYEFDNVEEMVIEQEVSAGGETQDVVVTNQLAEYQKSISLGPLGEQEAALFTSLTSPQVNVLGQQFNPIEEMSTDELAEMVGEEYDEIENLEPQEETDVTINGEGTTQTKYTADAVIEGNAVEVFVHISEAVEMGDDFVVTVGAYPELTPDEEENIITLMEAVEPDD